MPSNREIADRAEVAVSTVSLVLNDKPNVSVAMRQRVLKAVEELELEQQKHETYTPAKPQAPVSIVVLHATEIFTTSFFRRLLQGIQSATDRFGVQLRLANYLPEQIDELHKHHYLVDAHLRPSGVLIVESQQFMALSKFMTELGIPYVVRIDPTISPTLPAVGTNEINAGYLATNYLLNLGHRNIAFVGGGNRQPPYDKTYYVMRRLKGYKRALKEYDIAPDDRLISLSNDGQKATEDVLNFYPDITAMLFSTNTIAQQGFSVLENRQLSIPDDLSVIILDDLLDQSQYQPQITTIQRPGEKEGYWAVRLLMDIIHEPELLHGQYTFNVSLIERESCKAR